MFFWILFILVTIWLGVLSWCDCRYRRLPNCLTLPGVIVFPAMYFCLSGWNGMLYSFVGGLIGGAFLLLPYLLRGAGAGDVKMLLSVGCLSGFPGILLTLVITSIAGLILGAVMIFCEKTDPARIKHFLRCCVDIRYDRAAGKAALPEKKNEKVRIPYGVAIALGTWGNMLWSAYVMYAR